jgi:hypothetical protein
MGDEDEGPCPVIEGAHEVLDRDVLPSCDREAAQVELELPDPRRFARVSSVEVQSAGTDFDYELAVRLPPKQQVVEMPPTWWPNVFDRTSCPDAVEHDSEGSAVLQRRIDLVADVRVTMPHEIE